MPNILCLFENFSGFRKQDAYIRFFKISILGAVSPLPTTKVRKVLENGKGEERKMCGEGGVLPAFFQLKGGWRLCSHNCCSTSRERLILALYPKGIWWISPCNGGGWRWVGRELAYQMLMSALWQPYVNHR